MFALLFCLLLAFSASAVADELVNTTQTPWEGKQRSTIKDELYKIQEKLNDIQSSLQKPTRYETGLGTIVAQQIAELSSIKTGLMEKLQETKWQGLETRLQATETRLQATETKLQATETKLQATETRLKATELELAGQSEHSHIRHGGSTFIRWGKKRCPGNSTLVYAGVAGGKQHNQKGGGSNRLCLVMQPQFDSQPVPNPSDFDHIYGAEYEGVPGHHDHDVPCAVCRAPQSTTIMVSATLTCPAGWTPQYTGHLSAEHYTQYATEYVCLDIDPEDDTSGVKNDNGVLFYYVITQCGSLPCPPYIHNMFVTCVVCSK